MENKFKVKRVSLHRDDEGKWHGPDKLQEALEAGYEPVVQWNLGGYLVVFLRKEINGRV